MSGETTDLFFRVAHAHEGSPEERRKRYLPIAELVRPGDRVLDIGCGDGTFLELVRDRGAAGIGVDLDPEKAAVAREKGLEVRCGPVQEVEWDWGPVDFVSMLHIVEHLSPRDALSTLARAYEGLSERGRIFLLTPNISHPVVQVNFWLDVTHVRPYPALLLDTIMEELGFPYSQSGDMTGALETWSFGFRSPEDEIRAPRRKWRRDGLRVGS